MCWPATGCRCCDNYFSLNFLFSSLLWPNCDTHHVSVHWVCITWQWYQQSKHGLSLSSIAYVHFIHWHVNMVCVLGHLNTVMLADEFSDSSVNERKKSASTNLCVGRRYKRTSFKVCICDVKWFEVEVDYIIIYYLQMDILSLECFLMFSTLVYQLCEFFYP